MKITINDLEQDQALDAKAMKAVLGGSAPGPIGGWASMGTNARLRRLRRKKAAPKKSSSQRFSTQTDSDSILNDWRH